MTISEIDLLFPFFVFAYGASVTFVLHIPALIRVAENQLPPAMLSQIQAHRHLAFVCLLVGSLWSLQNLLLG
jgi:hypothetical protein